MRILYRKFWSFLQIKDVKSFTLMSVNVFFLYLTSLCCLKKPPHYFIIMIEYALKSWNFHRNKMRNNEYESVENLDADLTVMFENAKRYNVPHSSIYKRALKLQQIQLVSPKYLYINNIYANVCAFFACIVMFCSDKEKRASTKRGR